MKSEAARAVRRQASWFFLIFLFFYAGCRTTEKPAVPEPAAPDEEFSWILLDEKLWFLSYTDKELPLVLFALRADLAGETREGWEIVLTAPEPKGEWLMEGKKVSRFLLETESRAAVNGGPFSPYRYLFSGAGQNPSGLFVWEGVRLSPPRPDFAALAVFPDKSAGIYLQKDMPAGAAYALGGFQKLLTAGEPEALPESPKSARTLLGLSREGDRLFLVVADGERPGYSLGLDLREAAEWLRRLGAWEGMNLDGGGSSVMVLRDQDGGARIVNRPSNRRGWGERIVATHLGLKKTTESRK